MTTQPSRTAALIVITLTILYTLNLGITWAQSGVIFQKTWGVTGNASENGAGVAVDSSGNIYVTGGTSGLAADNLTIQGMIFLLKYNSTGTLVWQRTWSSSDGSTGGSSGIAVDSSGNNIYVTGISSFGAGKNDVLLLKFNSSGNLIWQRTYGSSGNEQGSSIAVDTSGNIYVAGDITDFGAGSADILLLKLDSSGNLLWQKTWGGIYYDIGSDVAVASSGDIYVTGKTGSVDSSLSQAALLKFDSSGDLLWQKTWGPGSNFGFVYSGDVAVDSFGHVYVAGEYLSRDQDIFLLKFNSSGSLAWQRTWDSGDWDYAEDVAVDSSGGIYVGGSVKGNVLLLKFDSSGNRAGQATWGNHKPGESEQGNSVAVDSSGNAVVTGYVDFGPPYTLEHPNGTIAAPSFGMGIPAFVLNTPTFLLGIPTGVVQVPSGVEDSTGKTGDAFIVKFAPLSYTENYTEPPFDFFRTEVFGLRAIEFIGLLGGTVILIGALTTTLLQERRKTVATQPTTPPIQPPAQTTEKTTGGFAVSLIAALLIMSVGLMMFWQSYNMSFTFSLIRTMGAVGIFCGEIVMIGALLMRTTGKKTLGGILAIIFSLFSVFGLGGYVIGLVLGTIGGAVGLVKPNRTKAALGFALALAAGSLSIFLGAETINEAPYPPSGWFALFTIRGNIPAWFAGVNLGTLGWIEIISGIIVTIGAILIFMPGKEKIGSVLAIVFSLVGASILGYISLIFVPMGILGGAFGLRKDLIKPSWGLGFALSLIGGSLMLIISLAWLPVTYTYASNTPGFILNALAAASGIIVLIAAILTYMRRKEKIGAILMIAFSMIGAMPGGLIFIGSVFSIIGGIIAFLKTETSEQPSVAEIREP